MDGFPAFARRLDGTYHEVFKTNVVWGSTTWDTRRLEAVEAAKIVQAFLKLTKGN